MPEVPVSVKIILSVDGKTKLEAVPALFSRIGKEAEKMARTHKVSYNKIIGLYNRMGLSSREYTERISHDNSYLAQGARKFSKDLGVSLEDAMSLMRGVGATSDKEWKGIGVDMKKGEKYAQELSQGFGVPLDDARAHLEKLGLQTRRFENVVHHDMDATTKTARAWSKEWGTSFRDSYLHVKRTEEEITKKFPQLGMDLKSIGERAKEMSNTWGISMEDAISKQKDMVKEVKNGGVAVTNLNKKFAAAGKGIGYQLTFVAWHFRYLGNIFDRISKSIIRGIKDVISVSAELQESFLSIRTATALYGQDSEKATQIVKDLALTGLLPLKEAANSVKNLMITGLGVPEMEKFAYRYLDVAFWITSGMDEMQKSLETISESILRGTTVLSADVTAKTLWTTTEKRLQRTMDKSLKDLSARQRALEILKTIEDKYAATLDLHKIEANTTRGAINRLTVSFELMKNALGIALLPLLNAVSDAFIKLSSYVEALIKVLGPTIPVMVAVGLAIAFVTSKLAVSIGIFLSFFQIMRQLSAMTGMAAISMWKIYLPLLAVGALVGGGVYLFLKYSGALDKAKQSAANIEEQFKKLQETITGINKSTEESIGIDDDRRISHERTVADIEEDLERERSKGLWANQMSIKDLEKRLSRENEDWDRYLKELGDKDVEGPTVSPWDDLLKNAMGTAENLGKIDFWGGLREKTEEIWEWLKEPKNWYEVGKKIGELISEGFELSIRLFKIIQDYDWDSLGINIGRSFVDAYIAGWKVQWALMTGNWEVLWENLGKLAPQWFLEGWKAEIAMLKGLYIAPFVGVFQRLGELLKDPFKNVLVWLRDQINTLIGWMNKLSPVRIKLLPSFSWEEGGMTASYIQSMLEAVAGGFRGLGGYQTGGIVPGMRNQAVPIIAHGGERVIPAGEVGGGGNITVNINSPVVRSQEDINSIARAVSNVLGQRQKFSRLGAF